VPESFNPLEPNGVVIQLYDLIKNILICIPKMNKKSRTGLNNMRVT